MMLRAIDFEVFGRVQGVLFRKYTKERADELELRGWCKNTPHGTVQGHIEGYPYNIEAMQRWLKSEGSPSCKIEKVEYKNQKAINVFNFPNFDIIKE